MNRAWLHFALVLSAFTPLNAALVLTFAEDSGGVSLSYSGQLNTSGLQFQGALTYSQRFFDIDGDQIIEFQNAQPRPTGQHSAFLGTSFRYSADNITFNLQLDLNGLPYLATAATGDTFGFYIFERSGEFITWMNLPYDYVSNSPIQGELRFDGQSFSSMGLETDEEFLMSLPGGETVAIQVQVPEPGIWTLLSLGLFVSASTRRRLRSN